MVKLQWPVCRMIFASHPRVAPCGSKHFAWRPELSKSKCIYQIHTAQRDPAITFKNSAFIINLFPALCVPKRTDHAENTRACGMPCTPTHHRLHKTDVRLARQQTTTKRSSGTPIRRPHLMHGLFNGPVKRARAGEGPALPSPKTWTHKGPTLSGHLADTRTWCLHVLHDCYAVAWQAGHAHRTRNCLGHVQGITFSKGKLRENKYFGTLSPA